ncbi:MAG: gliding motility-associated C-terminal domain-containing protein [Saprospiraceae bacterium]
MRIFIICLFFLCLTNIVQAQLVTIYSEDFSTYPDGTTGGDRWNGDGSDCDGTGASRVGVFSGRFEWRDMEGSCGGAGCLGGGQTDNVFEVGPIEINGCNVTASISLGGAGGFECDSPGAPLFSCNNSHDQLVVEYSVNGGPYQLFPGGYICGGGGLGTKTITGIVGNTLSIRVTGGNKAVDETYFIDNIVIRGNSTATVAITGPTSVCDGGSINLSASPGFADYTWSNGDNGQTIQVTAPGTYTVTATTAGGCRATATRNITLAPAPVVTITGTTQLCDGGNGTLTVTQNFSNYEWNTGQTGRTITIDAPGTYEVTVTDANGCIGRRSFTVNGGSPPNVTINPAGGQTSICLGSTLNLTATGAGITSYRWSNGATTAINNINRGGTYTVTVTNALGCGNEASIDIDENVRPTLNAIGTQNACGLYELPPITGTNLTGNELYYTAPNGGGQTFSPGDEITTTRLLYIFDGFPGCTAQTTFQVIVTPKPELNDIPDQNACDAYVLPQITGSTLTNGRAYYTGTNGTGTRFLPGDTIRTNRNLFIYDGTATCNDQESFSITVTPGPRVNDLRDTSICGGFTLPAITGTNLTPGASAYYTGPGATGTRFNPGNRITSSQTLYIYNGTATCFNEQTVRINITNGPQINPIQDTTVCNAFTLPTITGTNLSGNQAYFTASGGTGTRLNPGTVINTSQTLYVFDNDGICAQQDTFTVTIATTPTVNDLADVTQCSFYVLPTITGNNLTGNQAYFTQSNGGGIRFVAGDTIQTNTNLFIYDGATGCSDEESVMITILQAPVFTPINDQTTCALYVLPSINGTGLSGNQAYFTQPDGRGTRLVAGDTIQTTGTFYIFDDNGSCAAQDEFTLTIQPAPVLNPISDLSACEQLILPAIQGTNLTNNAAYFTQPNSAGTRFAPGDTIKTTTTLYAFNSNGSCTTQDTFLATIHVNPTASIRTKNVTCNAGQDGTMEVIVLGNAPFRFDWNGTTLDGQQNITNVAAGDYQVMVTDSNNCSTIVTTTITEPVPLELRCAAQSPASATNAADGSAQVILTNGTAPFQLTWSGASPGTRTVNAADTVTIANLAGGTYDLTLTDANGCTTTCSFAIGILGCNVTIDLTGTDATCASENNGSILTTITGAAQPIRYDWNVDSLDGTKDPTGLAPGNYRLTATDSNNCIINGDVQIGTQFPSPDVTISYSSIVCEDDCFNLDIELTGTPPFSIDYQISTNTGPIARTININSNRDTLAICPADFRITDGFLILQLLRLRDANCETSLNRTDTLVIKPISRDTVALTLCSTDSLVINGQVFNQAVPQGEVRLFGDAANGCDSIITVNLSFYPPAVFDLNQTICETDSILVNGTVYNRNNPRGTETLIGAAEHGCDSIVNINLQFFPPVTFTLNSTICETDSIVVNGRVYNQNNPQGTETLVGAAANGCDSIVNINLQFFPRVTFDLNQTICESDSLIVNGTVYNQLNTSGVETLVGVAANGCDSIININLQFFPRATFDLNQTICENDSIVVNGRVYNRTNPSGTEILNNASVNGCDSVININLQFFTQVTFDLNQTICTTDSIVVNGTVYNQNNPRGTEIFVGGSATGCDSLVNVNLQFFPTAVFDLNSTLCEGDSIIVNGKVYNQAKPSGTELIPGSSINSCDSIINVQLTFLEIARTNIDTTLCPGESLVVNGTTYNANRTVGTEIIQGGAANGCDSIVEVRLQFFAPAVFELNPTICATDSIIVNGNVYNRATPSGTEKLLGASVTGCDSTVNINLQFFPTSETTIDTTLCTGETLTVNGTVYNEQNPRGTELLVGASANGCDSLINIRLNYLPPAIFNLNRTICEDDTIIVNGRTYNRLNPSGTETLIGASTNGCDSIININLSFFPRATFDLNRTLCAGDSIVMNGTVYNQNNPRGTEILAVASRNGCDSIVNINLQFLPAVRTTLDTVLCPGESLTVNGTTYNQSRLTGTEIIRGGARNGCDSIIQVNLRYRPAISGAIEGNATICAGDSTTLTFRLSGATIFDIRYSDGTNTFTLNDISDRFTVRVAPRRTTTYTITFLSVDGTSCPAQLGSNATVQVSTLTADARVVTNYFGFGVSCFQAADGSIRAEAANGIVPITYRWNTGATTQQVSSLPAGNYSVTLTDAAGCNAVDSVTLTEPQAIRVSNSTRSPVCARDKNGIIRIDSISGGAAPFEVSLNGTSYRSINGFPYSINNLAAGNYRVFVRDANDCEITFNTAILAPSEPKVDLGPDLTIKLGDSVELVGLTNFDPSKIEWRPADSVSTPNALRTFVSPIETTTYALTISDTSGCTATDQITVFINRARNVFIPTAFSPDGDGINDFFVINAGDDVVRIKELRIFDRWGNMMFRRGAFQPNDPQFGWNGTFNGREVNIGVYVYYLEIEFIDGFVEIFEGDITVVR